MTSCRVIIPNHLTTQEMCNKAVRINSLSLGYVPDYLKTQEMCNKAVKNKLCMLLFVPDDFWMQEMCNEIMHTMPDALHRVPNRFKTQKMCDKRSSSSTQFVPDWFVTSEQMWMWYDDYYDNDDGDHRDDENEDF